ncbi:uncharacterized protein BKCO1_10000118 [Diplodia corticola]|uniref:Uncharacterized protein n=1 Tax=Diplodia corticola TaxID=236234 RepID=A0A1J9S863_9PEZI|nr:uncharacterized protein BKCO1_10000118 [Diplodia corticola]OJD36687.1 hypothetical protein BKCO1_10000118 [Diplodia corticola]
MIYTGPNTSKAAGPLGRWAVPQSQAANKFRSDDSSSDDSSSDDGDEIEILPSELEDSSLCLVAAIYTCRAVDAIATHSRFDEVGKLSKTSCI